MVDGGIGVALGEGYDLYINAHIMRKCITWNHSFIQARNSILFTWSNKKGSFTLSCSCCVDRFAMWKRSLSTISSRR